MCLLLSLLTAGLSGVALADDGDEHVEAYRWQLTADLTRLAADGQTVRFANREILRLDHPENNFRTASGNLVDNNASGLGKLMRVRSLSLLTLAAAGDTRLFIGVSDEGVPGVHFARMSKKQRARHVELSRLPFLAE